MVVAFGTHSERMRWQIDSVPDPIADSWHVRCSSCNRMTFTPKYSFSQEYDDSYFFQRLAFIDICCSPPEAN